MEKILIPLLRGVQKGEEFTQHYKMDKIRLQEIRVYTFVVKDFSYWDF